MKNIIIAALCFTFFLNAISYSKIITIFATATNVFYPNRVGAEVGDTIKWTAHPTEILHTTVCDGRPGTILPNGAVPWVSPVLSNGFYYVVRVPGFYRYICGVHGHSGTINATITNVHLNNEIIEEYNLMQNYPNPFNPVTKISFSIPKDEIVKLSVFDVSGNELNILLNGFRKSGNYYVTFNGNDMPSGIYFYKIEAGIYLRTRKMILIK